MSDLKDLAKHERLITSVRPVVASWAWTESVTGPAIQGKVSIGV